jgi:hypothetical protein
VLTLGDVLFDTGKATLKPGAYTTIDRLARVLNSSPRSERSAKVKPRLSRATIRLRAGRRIARSS